MHCAQTYWRPERAQRAKGRLSGGDDLHFFKKRRILQDKGQSSIGVNRYEQVALYRPGVAPRRARWTRIGRTRSVRRAKNGPLPLPAPKPGRGDVMPR